MRSSKVLCLSVLCCAITLIPACYDVSLFEDVPSNHWAYSDLVYLVQRGIITSLPGGQYGGSDPLDRYTAAAWIARAMMYIENDPSRVTLEDIDELLDLIYQLEDELEEVRAAGQGNHLARDSAQVVDVKNSIFEDVPSNHWAYSDLVYLVQRGIITSLPGGQYGGSDPLDRYTAAAWIARAMMYIENNPSRVTQEDIDELMDLIYQLEDELEEVRAAGQGNHLARDSAQVVDVKNSIFEDVPSNHWAYSDLVYLVQRGIITSLPGGQYGGSDPLDRYTAAAWIARAMMYIENNPSRVTQEDIDVLKDWVFELFDELNELAG